MTHTEAFEHFGTTPHNIQWSWSARNEETRTVVVTLWQDHFRRGLAYVHAGFTEDQRRRPGFRELMDNLAWAQDHCDGRFRVIVAIARNVDADPRSIAECFPGRMTMRLTHLDRETGAFTAEAERA